MTKAFPSEPTEIPLLPDSPDSLPGCLLRWDNPENGNSCEMCPLEKFCEVLTKKVNRDFILKVSVKDFIEKIHQVLEE